MAKLEAAIAARQQEEEEARLKREQEKETAIRSQQKEKVNIKNRCVRVTHSFCKNTRYNQTKLN